MIPVLSLRLHYAATAAMPTGRYSGDVWRSGFGANLRRLACITGADTCEGCPVRATCAYGQVFDAIAPANAQGLNAQHREQPHPYVLCPLMETADQAALNCTLIGPAIAHSQIVVRALQSQTPSTKHPAQWRLQRITSPHNDDPVWQVGQPLMGFAASTPSAPPAPTAVRVHLLHPTRLRVLGKYLGPQDLSFVSFFATLLRRIQMLHGLDQTSALNIDPPALLNHAKTLVMRGAQLQWTDWARYSARQRQRIPMGGVTGVFELHGDLTPIWPLLHLGQGLHVGKGTVMGLGRYRLEALP